VQQELDLMKSTCVWFSTSSIQQIKSGNKEEILNLNEKPLSFEFIINNVSIVNW